MDVAPPFAADGDGPSSSVLSPDGVGVAVPPGGVAAGGPLAVPGSAESSGREAVAPAAADVPGAVAAGEAPAVPGRAESSGWGAVAPGVPGGPGAVSGGVARSEASGGVVAPAAVEVAVSSVRAKPDGVVAGPGCAAAVPLGWDEAGGAGGVVGAGGVGAGDAHGETGGHWAGAGGAEPVESEPFPADPLPGVPSGGSAGPGSPSPESEPRVIDGGAQGDGSVEAVVGNGSFGVTVEGVDGVRRAAQAGALAPGGGPSGGVASIGRGDPIQPSPSQYRWVVGSAGSLYHPGWTPLTPALRFARARMSVGAVPVGPLADARSLETLHAVTAAVA